MAQLNFTITYPNDKQTELVAALRHHYGKKEDGSDWTPLELQGFLQDYFKNHLKTIYRKWKVVETPTEELDAS